jgi:hypothetical protein
MPAWEKVPSSDFALRFPGRFSIALSDARGAIAGVAASASKGRGGLIDPGTLRRLHEIFRLRIELELEVAAVLWQTAEVVRAMTDATRVLHRRRAADSDAGDWRPGAPADQVVSRPSRLALGAQQVGDAARWRHVEVPAAPEAASYGAGTDRATQVPGWRAAA